MPRGRSPESPRRPHHRRCAESRPRNSSHAAVPALEAVGRRADRAHGCAPALHRTDWRSRDHGQHGGEHGPGLVRPRRHRDDRRAHASRSRPLFTALTRRPHASCCWPTGATSRSRIPRSTGCASSSRRRRRSPSGRPAPRISRYQADLWADFEDLADQAEPAVSLAGDRRGRCATSTASSRRPCRRGSRAELRPYQRAGFDWLAFLWRHRLGGILADDMGLGKTLQMLALIAHAREAGRAPAVPRRRADLRAVAPGAARPRGSRPACASRSIDATRAKRRDALARGRRSRADVVVTSYTLLRLDDGRVRRRRVGGARARRGAVRQEPPDEAAPRARAICARR